MAYCYPTVVDRYFTRRYKSSDSHRGDGDVGVLCHSNKVVVVVLAPSHPVIKDGKTVLKVNYKVGKTLNRLDNKAVGKSKKGAQHLKPSRDVLCRLECSDGEVYRIYTPVRGALLEVNEHLTEHPNLVTEQRETKGHLAIILVHKDDYTKQIATLEDEEIYQARINAEGSPPAVAPLHRNSSTLTRPTESQLTNKSEINSTDVTKLDCSESAMTTSSQFTSVGVHDTDTVGSIAAEGNQAAAMSGFGNGSDGSAVAVGETTSDGAAPSDGATPPADGNVETESGGDGICKPSSVAYSQQPSHGEVVGLPSCELSNVENVEQCSQPKQAKLSPSPAV